MSGLLVRVMGVCALVVAAATPVAAQQPVPAGHIKTVSGAAFVVRQHGTIPAKPGDATMAELVRSTLPS